MVRTASDVPRALIVAEHASLRFGGEAALPVHYFMGLRKRGIEAWLVVHERTRDELSTLLADDLDRVHYLPDTALNRFCWRAGSKVPAQISYFTFGYASRISTQLAARRIARRLVRDHGVTVVHQPIPVSPRETSLLHDMGAPVVIGPMNGNMSYPPAFRGSSRGERVFSALAGVGRALSGPLHRLMPGKRKAAMLLVANARTRAGLPPGITAPVRELVENGVDLDLWTSAAATAANAQPRFVFMGRLVDWKAVDVLIEALSRMQHPASLEIIGDGPMRPALEQLAHALGAGDRVHFAGWLPQSECAARLVHADALVLSSIYECGGAVVLEAMACGRPAIATNWGGPADYIDEASGILVPPASREALVAGFAAAMDRLAGDPALRQQMGHAARLRVEQGYAWSRKIDTILEIYRDVSVPEPDRRNSPLAPAPAKG